MNKIWGLLIVLSFSTGAEAITKEEIDKMMAPSPRNTGWTIGHELPIGGNGNYGMGEYCKGGYHFMVTYAKSGKASPTVIQLNDSECEIPEE